MGVLHFPQERFYGQTQVNQASRRRPSQARAIALGATSVVMAATDGSLSVALLPPDKVHHLEGPWE